MKPKASIFHTKTKHPMRKVFYLLSTSLLLTVFSCKKSEPAPQSADDTTNKPVLVEKKNPIAPPLDKPQLTREEIDATILNFARSKNDFRWSWVDIHFIWSAAQFGDNAISIGYKPAHIADVHPIMHEIDLQDPEWKAVHDALIDLISKGLGNASPADFIIEDDPVMPILTVKLTDLTVLTQLSNLENIRYLEPLDYRPAEWDELAGDRSTSGCGGSSEPLNSSDWTNITPNNCRLPWNFNNVTIPAAWETSQGLGVKIGIIDAGLSSSQTLLGADFNNGDSNVGRTLTTAYTWGNSVYSTCTHGTSMSGLAVGPRNNLTSTTGVAYKSSLHFIRGCEDVVLDKSSERTGVKNALIQMGDNASIKIVSMSVGTPFYSSVLKDGVVYAYNKGKMLFAAAGTSFSWTNWWGVVYPAAFSECNAITGTDESGSTCYTCHDGSQVDFTVPMERNANNERTSLSYAMSGTTPTYIGGSSCSTAMAAGIAGLIWSARPSLTREQVFTCLRNTAANYPNANNYHGWGKLNAGAAVAMALTL